jgi:hypothetical protein
MRHTNPIAQSIDDHNQQQSFSIIHLNKPKRYTPVFRVYKKLSFHKFKDCLIKFSKMFTNYLIKYKK